MNSGLKSILLLGILLGLTLFIYSRIESHDRAIEKIAYDKAQAEQLEKCNEEREIKSQTIIDLKGQLTRKTDTISQMNTFIANLTDTIRALKNRPPEIVTHYQDRTLYRDRPEPYHQYGKGYGKIVIYTTCQTVKRTKVWIDGDYAGSYNRYYNSAVGCEATYGVSKIVITGKHHIYTKDDSGGYTDFYLTVNENQCTSQQIVCR